uniref:Uncharacterized protein n=1 Tax=Wuchereria bancrofti TaxID=6293 RepID=A0AAF5Q6K0_WUCBA
MPNGRQLERPINMLCPMEINSFNEKTEEKPENKSEEPIASRIRIKTRLQNLKAYQRSCQNRNNLLLLIEWLSISNPTLAARLLLQKNDVMAKRVSGKLLITSCKTMEITIQNIEFKGNLINKLEVERVNAELELLARRASLARNLWTRRRNSNTTRKRI